MRRNRRKTVMGMLNFLLQNLFTYQLACSVLIRPEPFVAQEGQLLNVSCVAEEGESTIILLFFNGTSIMRQPRFVSAVGIDRGAAYLFGPITRSDDGLEFVCNNGQPISATLQVRFPPSAPQLLNVSNISPFSVDVTWSTPLDIGNPPGPLTYTVTLTNLTDGNVLQYTLPSTQITLSNLLPGVQYNVSVYAKNSVASGPPVTGVFRTNNSVPIIRQVVFSTEQLRLFVNIIIVTNGGLPVSAYHITINGRTITFPSTSGANQLGARLELIGVLLRGGNTFPFSVQVENELGNSSQVDSSLVGVNTPNVETIAVPVLSASVGLFGAVTLTAIVAAVIVGVCVCRNKRTKDVTEDSLAPPYESPGEVNNVHKRSQEQEMGIQSPLQPNPSYEPLKVCESALEVKDVHKKNCVAEAQETSLDTKMQANPSYEPLKV